MIITIEVVWFPCILFWMIKYWWSCKSELQAPGMGIEAEAAVAIVNSTKSIIPTSPKASTGIANDSTTTFTASLLMTKDEEQDKKKHLLRLKLGKKINGIYGDWIDD